MTNITAQTSNANINKLIRNIKTTANKYNTLVQDAIVAIVIHANDYGDCTGAARLLDAMPRSNRRQLVVDHFAQYSPINVSRDKDGTFKASLRKPFHDKEETKPNKNYNAFYIDGVRANNWWQRPEAERLADVVDYTAIHTKVLAFLESQLKKADKCENDNDKQKATAFIKVVRSAASAYNAELTKGDTEWEDEEAADLDEEARVALKAVA